MRDHHQRWRHLNVPPPRASSPLASLTVGIIAFSSSSMFRASRYRPSAAQPTSRYPRPRQAPPPTGCGGKPHHVAPDVDQQRSFLTHGDKIDGLTVEGCCCAVAGEILRQRGLAEIVHRQGYANQQPYAQLTSRRARSLLCHGVCQLFFDQPPCRHTEWRPPSGRR